MIYFNNHEILKFLKENEDLINNFFENCFEIYLILLNFYMN